MTSPLKFRKKPVVVEAMQLTGETSQFHTVYKWIEDNTLGSFEPLDVIEGRSPYPYSGVSIDPRDGRLIISTLEGLHWADPGDWIIRGVKGEFYPCKSVIFEATYELVDRDVNRFRDAVYRFRDSITGQFITEVEASDSPDTTVRETH